jgi:putative ABC transport system permease protein
MGWRAKMEWRTNWLIALRSLRRNKLQTLLTMLGMTIGVATVLTMISLGSGAQKAIQEQVKAAGMNVLVVTAGNFQARREKPPDDAIEMGSLRTPAPNSGPHLIAAAFHPEDDPFAIHDHPTAAKRLGDSEAGLGSAATLTMEFAKFPPCSMYLKAYTKTSMW